MDLKEFFEGDVKNLSYSQKIELFYKLTIAPKIYIEEMLYPVLIDLFKKNEKYAAIIGTYLRLFFLLDSLVVLNKLEFYQTIAANARSIFELYIDMLLFNKNIYNEGIEKYFYFILYEKNKANSIPITKDIDNNIIKLWGTKKNNIPNYPKHWTGTDLKNRITKLNDQELDKFYKKDYKILSWHIHSGGNSFMNSDDNFFHKNFILSLSISLELFFKSTFLLFEEIIELKDKFDKFDEVYRKFRKIIDNYKLNNNEYI
jgi:hypothetical protein